MKTFRRQKHVRLTVALPVPLVELVRGAVARLGGSPLRLTVASLVASALRREVARLERTQNNGSPFHRRRKPLNVGRPRNP
jgi:hypothetical protein